MRLCQNLRKRAEFSHFATGEHFERYFLAIFAPVTVGNNRTVQLTFFPAIRKDTYIGITALLGDRPLACPYKSDSDWYRFWKAKVITPAGVRHGALQQIRRTGATYLAIGHPDAVQRYLGHRTASMQRHYVDQSIATPQQHLPPEIGAA